MELSPEMESSMKRIQVTLLYLIKGNHPYPQQNKTVSGVMLINKEGIPIKTNMDSTSTVQVFYKRKYSST